MAFHLQVIDGPDKGRVLQLADVATLLVGRSSATQAALNDPRVSRVHCRLRADGDRLLVNDAMSSGGTFVNDHRIVQHVLRPGDVLRIGGTVLRVHAGSVADRPLTPPSHAVPESRVPAVDPLESTLPWDMQFHEPDSAAAAGLIEVVGSRVADFELGPALGQGKTGIVFLARDVPRGRLVALKILRPDFASNADQLHRFERAMKISSSLCHPNLVPTYGTGKWKSCCWIAMEYIEGRSAARFIRNAGIAGRLNWRIALRLAHDIARALQFAHDHSILHRNVTPNNVLMTKDHVAKLGDLMLAKALDDNNASQISAANAVLGDVPYLSPEQTHGTRDVDARSDLYSLGATVYAVVTGRPPFGGKTAAEIVERIRHQPARSLREAQSVAVKSRVMTSFQREHITLQLEEMPVEFDRLILRTLAKRADERYECAADFVRHIEQVAAKVGITLSSAPTLRQS